MSMFNNSGGKKCNRPEMALFVYEHTLLNHKTCYYY